MPNVRSVGLAMITALLSTAVVSLAGSHPAVAASETSQSATTVTVLTRNIYLGADVGVALALLPDMPAAAQFMWDQMRANDITERAVALAGEIKQGQPDVIGLQEATTWSCSTGLSEQQVVYDFTDELLQALAASGQNYVVASTGANQARNPGFSIGPIPLLTTVHDPQVFQPLFGSDDAQCGFTVADVLLVRESLQASVMAAGTVEYQQDTAIVPALMVITRGYAWADISIGGTPTRFVTTHLESIWNPNEVPAATRQAQQLAQDLSTTAMPLVVLGDFNSDPRDPRPADDNPGDQPEISQTCPAQGPEQVGDASCSAYWTMVRAGFTDAGPDMTDGQNMTWGVAADLAAPDPTRNVAAIRLGNSSGMTERIDFVFVRNDVRVKQASVIGNSWQDPMTTWSCGQAPGRDDPKARCLASDHAGVLATLSIPGAAIADPPLASTRSTSGASPVSVVLVGAILLLGLFAFVMIVRIVRIRARRRHAA
ncbi:MAG: endonuclease/exonuclease/phosphatase family protein [Actinomycetales bacterium]|nr:endonuclease/exonuclease/phosphatase family protein [Actinomycetales bacterium]